MIKDEFYDAACNEAKEDFFLLGIQRTDEEVERKANNLRKQALDKQRSSVLYQGETLKVKHTGKSCGFFYGQVIDAKPRMCHKSGLPYPQPKWIACCYEITDEDGDRFPVAEERYGKLYKGFEWVYD
jgi:hypothetical protein